MMSSYAMRECDSRGRRFPEELADQVRGIFERDTDRIIHSRAFKRLAGKTQVITGRRSDHHRTRLTHSIEVATLCRSVADKLGLNTHLAACLGFCHDLGHPPLGHCGEEILNEICQHFSDSFEHNRHTLTIVDEFEQKYAFCPGLNLSYEVREGIIKHSTNDHYRNDPTLAEFDFACQPPLESQIVDFCDEICYSYSDLDDALEAGFVVLDVILRELDDFRELYTQLNQRYPGTDARLIFNETLRRMMNLTVRDMTATIERELAEAGVVTVADVRRCDRRLVGYSPDMGGWVLRLKQFLRVHYYQHPEIQDRRQVETEKIRRLFEFYAAQPERLPSRYREMIRDGRMPMHRVIVYYIAGFTDNYFTEMADTFGI
ncbi:MAG TPA: HD domain-containing protein [Acidobacteriota bacterium]|nr:HD domain-containing protein [Acidobacteriota bacterium]HQO24455.1 HD domain-containing protein [Acidobacteriota bacterium]